MDAIDTLRIPQARKAAASARMRARQAILSWLTTWEIYPILLVAGFLRFYDLPLTEFDADQAILSRLSREAIMHGLIPATGTVGSIGQLNPPGYTYFFLPVAVFTANPLADTALIALVNVLASLATYIFTRRYFGRLAGIVAALLFATAFQAVTFSRFIWQPNLFPFFVALFMLALFWGAVERRPGWIAFALPLLGWMAQLHFLAFYLAVPLLVAVVLAPKTVRWRDIVIGGLLFALIFSTYLVWEISVHFADISVMLTTGGKASKIDSQAVRFYLNQLSPYITQPTDPRMLLVRLVPILRWERLGMFALVLGGFLLALLGLVWPRVQIMDRARFPEPGHVDRGISSFWRRMWDWWKVFSASPQRSALLLLLVWQIVPVLLLTRHAVALQPQYFLLLLPGPFILIGVLVKQVASWCGALKGQGKLLRFALPAVSLVLIALQVCGTMAWLLDEEHGLHYHSYHYTTFQDMQVAFDDADRLARKHHLRHIYIDTDARTYETFTYLSQQMKTPHTTFGTTSFNPSNCLVLPSAALGPAVMLLGPGDTLDATLLGQFTTATLISTPPRLGGPPFRLYIVQPLSVAPGGSLAASPLVPAGNHPGSLVWNDPNHPEVPAVHLFETLWTGSRSFPASEGTRYTATFNAYSAGNGTGGQSATTFCNFSSLVPGEQLLVPFRLPQGSTALPASLQVTGSIAVNRPYELDYGPLRFQSIRVQSSALGAFQAAVWSNRGS